jgi:general secretion pathway protein G
MRKVPLLEICEFLRRIKMRAKSGFTLVEILIVVVILGILAAIVIPQFTEASSEAKESRLVSDLQMMRSQIELYKIQHNDRLPGVETVAGPMGSTGAATFVECMTGYTDQWGDVAAAPGAGIYGPYMQKLPTNPFNDPVPLNTVTFNATVGAGNPGADGAGWNFDPANGLFQADDAQLSGDGVTYHSEL